MTSLSTPASPVAPSPATALLNELLDPILAAIAPLDHAAVAAARARQDRLTKPQGALGVLEEISVQLSGLAGRCPPPTPQPAAVAVFAADHGVHAQGVTPWPQEVTAQMVATFLAGNAAVNVLAAGVGARVVVVDVGVATPIAAAPGLLSYRVSAGTRDLTAEPAMSTEQALHALEVGAQVATELIDAGAGCLLTGDMGIANTTPSAALIAAFTGADAAQVTGRGTGVSDQMWQHKVNVVRAGLTRHADVLSAVAPTTDSDGTATAPPIAVVQALAAIGGLEHAALAGFILAGAARRVPVILDGVIAGAAAVVAAAIDRRCLSACIAGHRSAEPGHRIALTALGLRPLIELDLRLGEGTGAVLALPLVQSAARILRDMASFDTTGIVDRGERP